ncbi:ABC transporter [Lacticaseibacillus casei]|uniref:ABC transporter permease n=1 Tax=Lacticaseibacillus zeae TaxID=57037 RepID=A0A5R8LW61_LACZE|nr:ABC transporter permease [Lacticaseibacillus zeae]OLS06069.1 ABC transporter [Lacticaseibacillus casei]QVI32013.1 ABC transporter permease [Lacticaseibacillus zeae]TLF41413.1 ABC transporter permease [Lacticaseibacillus zeae]
MEIKDNYFVDKIPKQQVRQFWGLIRWSLIRHKVLLPAFSMTQVVLALAIVYGLALLMPNMSHTDILYLSSGAITIGIIAVGCVLAAQIVSTAKQDGVVAYQKTLPVARTKIILADVIIWSLASIPGVIMSCIAATSRFHVDLYVSPISITVIVLAQITMVLIGFSLAYWLSANAMALTTQVIMIGGLLFSPITYPADRIPFWLTSVYELLPFVPASNLIRATLFHATPFSYLNLLVLLMWLTTAFALSLLALSKRS